MPPRLNKRQQRELEELETLGTGKVDAPSDDEEALEPPRYSTAAAGFSAFLIEGDEESEDDDSQSKPSKSRKSKKKKKKVGESTPLETPAAEIPKPSRKATPTHIMPPRNEKKALKRAKAKEKKAGNDELDQALAELSVKYPELQKISDGTTGSLVSSTQNIADLLSVSLAHLDSEAEMRKFFGSKVVQANKTSAAGPAGSSRRKAGVQRSHLTRPQPSWWAAKQREGLSIRTLTEEEIREKLLRQAWDPVEEKWWTVEYSKKYKSMTKSFMHTVMSGDPQGFWDLLGKLPWHGDTLLQLAEVYRHREEYAQAVDFVDRALFTYERSFIGAFNFIGGTSRLDFDRVENRPFFLAIHRQVADLQRRGCVRTAFEFARLLYSLDPWNDPHGALLHLDFLAIKAGMHQWLLDLSDAFVARRKQRNEPDTRLDPTVLPGWSYAIALALRISEDANKDENHEESTAALKEAILTFPSVVPLLADKLDISLPASIRGHPDFKIETDGSSLSPELALVHLLSHLYVQRSFPLWKESEHSAWFVSVVTDTFSSLPSALSITERRKNFLSYYQHPHLQYSSYRHVVVLESTHRRLFSFLPRKVLDAKSLACDPLPPPTSVTEYNQDFFEGIEDMFSMRTRTRQERAADERRLAQLIPDAAFRQQLQAFFEGNQNVAGRFPGGILQFAQIVGQLPEEVLEDMMLAEAMGDGRGMPGQMPGFEEVADDAVADGPQPHGAQPQAPDPDFSDDGEEQDVEDDEDDEEDEEEISPMPRMLRNLLGRLWGRPAVAEDSSDEDETRAELNDLDGVD